jgi:hypothetical protein
MPEKPRKKKSKVVKKKRRQISTKASWMACGFDLSLSSLAGAAFAYDKTLDKVLGPVTLALRWERNTDYFSRMSSLVKAHDFIHDLQSQLRVIIEPEDVFIAVEEPFPVGMIKQLESNSVKQQSQLSGAFLGGLLRWGFTNIYEISNLWWRQVVAEELGISIHHTKWRDPKMTSVFHCHPKDVGKFRAKQWVLEHHPEWGIPEWPDLINNKKLGLIPRPETSKAKGKQSDDRYEAIPMAEWMRRELLKGREDASS